MAMVVRIVLIIVVFNEVTAFTILDKYALTLRSILFIPVHLIVTEIV